TAMQRVAAALLRLADKFGQPRRDGSTLIQIPLTRADVAGMSGTTTETVSRIMSTLRADGIIESGRRWTAIVDHESLAGIVADVQLVPEPPQASVSVSPRCAVPPRKVQIVVRD